jgi:hypothetical protein
MTSPRAPRRKAKQPRTQKANVPPAVTSAKRASRQSLVQLQPTHVFLLAAIAETFRYGYDRGRWHLSFLSARSREKDGGAARA